MAKRRQSILRDPRYPGGVGIVLAWDYHVDGTLEVSTLLLRTSNEFTVHRSINDGTLREQIFPATTDGARILYEHMPIHFAGFPETEEGQAHTDPATDEDLTGEE